MAANWTLRHRATRPASVRVTCSCATTHGSAAACTRTTSAYSRHCLSAGTVRLDRRGRPPGRPRRSVAGKLVGGATDVFWESIPIPPVKIVEAGEIRDVWRICTCAVRGCPSWSRSTCGPRSAPTTSPTTACARCARNTARQPSKRSCAECSMMPKPAACQAPRVTQRILESVAHQDSARSGDRGIYKIVCTLTKSDDKLVFDFTGTDPRSTA